AAGKIAAVGVHHPHAAFTKDFNVGLRGGVLPHVHVHSRRNHHRSGGGQEESCKEIIGFAMGEFGQNVSRGGRHNERINGLRHRNVFNGGVDIGLLGASAKKICDDFFSTQGGKGERPDKL